MPEVLLNLSQRMARKLRCAGTWMRRQGALIVLLACAALDAQAALGEPIPRIEAGMHRETITSASVDAAGRYVVTSSWRDHTVRIWDRASGRELRVLRSTDADANGALYAAAITPDGKTVLASEKTARSKDNYCIDLFDRSSGKLKDVMCGLPRSAMAMSLSGSGRWLATVFQQRGLRIWDMQSRTPTCETDNTGSPPSQLSWSHDEKLAMVSSDHLVRVYGVDGKGLASVLHKTPINFSSGEASGDISVAFSPDGSRLAMAEQAGRVQIFSDELKLLQQLNTNHVAFFKALVWSADGNRLYGGGDYKKSSDNDNDRTLVRSWDLQNGGRPHDLATTLIGDIQVMLPVPNASDNVLVFAEDPAWGLLAQDGSWRTLGAAPQAFYGLKILDQADKLRVSSDGSRVELQTTDPQQPPYLDFDLATRTLQPADEPQERLSGPLHEGHPEAGWKGVDFASREGKALGLPEFDVANCLAVLPGSTRFLVGSKLDVYLKDASGKDVWVLPRPRPGSAEAITVAPSRPVAVVAYSDGSIRWHRLKDGQELLALFVHADGKHWVLWTPSGYYDSSAGGDDLFGWEVHTLPNQPPDFFPASRFADRFRRPDVISRILLTLDEGQAIAQADAVRQASAAAQPEGDRSASKNLVVAPAASVAQVLPPVIDLLSPAEVTTNTDQLTVKMHVRSPNAIVTALTARVNGQLQPQTRNLVVQPTGDVRELVITLPHQDSDIQLFAESKFGTSVPAQVHVSWTGANTQAKGSGPPHGKLWVLAVGVSNYQNSAVPKLTFAAKDAQDFVQEIRKQEGRLYSRIEAKVLTDENATRGAVEDGLQWLQDNSQQDDVAMLFISGHGYSDPSEGYMFVPVDADPQHLKRDGVTMSAIKATLSSMLGRTVVFLDTCHAGGALGHGDLVAAINGMSNPEHGVVVFSSSTGQQLSQESAKWNNGAFTRALVDGLQGKADIFKKKIITFKQLDTYLSDVIPNMTNNEQKPVTQAPGGVPDFPIALLQ